MKNNLTLELKPEHEALITNLTTTMQEIKKLLEDYNQFLNELKYPSLTLSVHRLKELNLDLSQTYKLQEIIGCK